MKEKYLAIFCLALVILTTGVVSASDIDHFALDTDVDALGSIDDGAGTVDGGVGALDYVDDGVCTVDGGALDYVDDGACTVDNVDAVDEKLSSADASAGVLGSDEVNPIGANGYLAQTHVEINSYNILDNCPHSVDLYNDSDYVARIYAPSASTGEVDLLIANSDDFNDPYQIFTSDIMDLDSEKDENYYGYSYFYIRPSDIVESILPDLYQVTVVYRYGFSLTETGEGFVRLVDDPRHVIVDAPSEIAFGDCKDDFINIYVEGTKGYLRVLLDGEEVINDSVFNLRYENDSDSPKNFISISLDDLSIGTHTYNVSYFDGNWDNVSFSDEIDVTYLFEVSTEADDIFYDDDYVYYGDDVNFLISLPYDARGNRIEVNGVSYPIDLVAGIANLTLSGFEIGNHSLLFTYDDAKYGEKSVLYDLQVVPKLIIPDVVAYGNGDELKFKLPADAQGKINIYAGTDGLIDLVDSVDLVNGEANYSFDSWDLGSYEVFVEYEGILYELSDSGFVNIVPNVIHDNESIIGENVPLAVNIFRVNGNIVVSVNGQSLMTEEIVNGKINVTIPSSALHIGNNIITFAYEGDDLDFDPFTYDLGFDEPMPIEYVLDVAPGELNIPTTLSDDGQGNIILQLPNGSNGNVDVYVDHNQLASAPVSGGENIIPLQLSQPGDNIVTVFYTDANGNTYESSAVVNVLRAVPSLDVEFSDDSSVIAFTAHLPADAKGTLFVDVAEETYPIDIVNGEAKFSLSGLADGLYIVNLEYLGDEHYEGFSNGYIKVVGSGLSANLPRTITVEHTDAGDVADVQAAIDSANPGDTIQLGDYDYTNLADINITKSLNIEGTEGTTITSTGDGTPIFNVPAISQGGPDSVNITNIDFKLNNVDVAIKATADNDTNPMSIVTPSIRIAGNVFELVNDNVVSESVIILELDSERGVLSPTGEIDISGNTIAAGVSPFEFIVTSINSGGDTIIVPQNITVERKATVIVYEHMNTTAVSPADGGKTGEYFIWRLTDADGKPLANTPMEIGFNGVVYNYEKDGIITDADGYAKLQINLGYKGVYTFAICFLGNDQYNASFVVAKITVDTQKGTLTVPNKSYAATAKTKTLTATFKTANGNPIADKWITFTVNGKTYKAKTNDNGVATVNVSLNTKGTYKFVAKFAGDSTYTAIEKTAQLTLR